MSIIRKRICLHFLPLMIMQYTGFYRLLSSKDFALSIYTAQIVETLTQNLPLLAIVLVNNVLLEDWSALNIAMASMYFLNLVVTVKEMFQ